MSKFFVRLISAALLFLVVFFYPFSFTASSRLTAFEPMPQINQNALEKPQPELLAETQKAVPNQQSPVNKKELEPSVKPVKAEQILPSPRQAHAAELPRASTPSLIYHIEGGYKVGLTFDDGPYREMTEDYLTILKNYNVRATFFMVGQRIKFYPELARKVAEQGNEIGSHSWWHGRLNEFDPGHVYSDLQSVSQQVYNTIGKEVTLLRPPYGLYSGAVIAAAKKLDQKIIIWDVDPKDWEDLPPAKIVENIVAKTKPGSIILLHEGHKNTLQALPQIIEKLRERKLEPVPVSELLEQLQATGERKTEKAPAPASSPKTI